MLQPLFTAMKQGTLVSTAANFPDTGKTTASWNSDLRSVTWADYDNDEDRASSIAIGFRF
ncbi:MAG: hypothetical protein IPH20_20255 [Bacteroidales bacterium]|nr:hypothetical protein [Bacteroidales bacterium]